MRGFVRWCGALVVAGGLVGSAPAWAQNAAEKAAADTLFNEGKRLISRGEVGAACEKFEASLAKVVQLGTQIALASCYEKQGKTASAWAEFRAAASTAAKAHDRRQRYAEEHAAALEPRLSKMAVVVIANRVAGLEVRRDGAEVPSAELGSPVPVDPGEHTVEASAPGRVAWSIKVSVPPAPGVVDVPIPALEKETARAPEPALTTALPAGNPEPVTVSHRSRRLLAYGVGGGGAAVIGVSLIFGAVASSKWSDSKAHCRDNQCDQTGVDLAGSAHTMGNVSTALFVVGLAAVATGGYLLLTTPSDREAPPAGSVANLRIAPALGPSQIGISFAGGF